jgi:sulfur carrier protein
LCPNWLRWERECDRFMKVIVNAQQLEVDERTTVAALLESLGFPDRGVAVALDQAVLPALG